MRPPLLVETIRQEDGKRSLCQDRNFRGKSSHSRRDQRYAGRIASEGLPMIDAGPSLEAAKGLAGTELLNYLLAKGWTARPSRIDGISIVSKNVPGADGPAEFILPVE